MDGTDRTPVVLGTEGTETGGDGDTPMPGTEVSETGEPVGTEPGMLTRNVEFPEIEFRSETRRFRADAEAVAVVKATVRKLERRLVTGRWLRTR